MPFFDNLHRVFKDREFEHRYDVVPHELGRDGAADQIAEPFFAQGDVLFKLNSSETVIPAFRLNWDYVLLTGFSNTNVEFVDFDLNSVYLRAQMALQGVRR